MLLLLLLSRFSRVRLCVTPQTAAHQAPPSLGLSRQEHWSGLPFPFPMHESEKWKWSCSVVSDLATPWTAAYQAPPSMGFSRQEYWLEWGTIAFSDKHHIHLKKKKKSFSEKCQIAKLGQEMYRRNLGILLCQKARTKTIRDIMTSHPKNTGTNLKQLSLLENGIIWSSNEWWQQRI